MKLTAAELLKIAGLAGLAISPFLGVLPAGMVVGNAILQNLAASGGYQMLEMGGSNLRRRFFNKLGQPNHHLNKALQFAILDALEDVNLEKEFRAIHPPGKFDRDGGHLALEMFFQQLRNGKYTLALPDADNPSLVGFLEDATQENFETLAKTYPSAAFPGLPPEVPEFVFRRLHSAVAARFWDHVKNDAPTWHAYATEVFAQMRESLQGIGEKQDQILALLAGRETLVLHSSGPAAVSPDLFAAIEQQGKNWTAESHRVRQQLDRVEWKITEIKHDTTILRRALPWIVTGIVLALGTVFFIKHDTGEAKGNSSISKNEALKQTVLLERASGERGEILRLLQQQGRKIEDITQQEIETELARRLGVSGEILREMITAGKQSADSLIRSQAQLLAGERQQAIASATEAKQQHSVVVGQLIEADKIIAQAHYEVIEYEPALAARKRIAMLIDHEAEPLAWADAQHEVALVLRVLDRYAEAVTLLEQVIPIKERVLGHDDPSVATSLCVLGTLLELQGRLVDSEELYRRALEIGEAKLGKDHPYVAAWLNNLASLLQYQGKLIEAEPLYRRALEIAEAKLGNDNPEVARVANSLAGLLQAQGKLKEAESLFRRALEIDEAKLGKDHPDVARDLSGMASLLQAQNKPVEAEPFARRALEINESKLGKDHRNVGINLNDLALLLQNQGRLAEAEPLFRRSLEISESKGENHPDLARGLSNLALLLQAQGGLGEAESLFRRALEIGEAKLGKDHPDVARYLNNLARLLKIKGKLAEAEVLYSRALEIDETKLGKNHPNVAIDLHNRGNLLQAQGKLEEAEPFSRRALVIAYRHRKQNGTALTSEKTLIENYLLLLKTLGRSDEQIIAEVLKLQEEAGQDK